MSTLWKLTSPLETLHSHSVGPKLPFHTPQQCPEFVDLTGGAFSTTWALDGVRGDIYSGMINNAQYSVLAQMAESTADPALAIQAFFTTLFATTYYDRIIMFDTTAPSLQVSLVQVIRPLGWTAYTIVVTIVVSHLLLVLLTIIIFYKRWKAQPVGKLVDRHLAGPWAYHRRLDQ